MSFFKVKIRPSDRIWTKYIRLRDKDICQWCGQEITNLHNSGVSHYHERRCENTRYDDDNCDLMHNIPCHTKLEHEKKIKGIKGATEDGEYTKFMKNKLGQDKFDYLLMRSHITGTRDDEMAKIIIKEKLEQLKREAMNV